MDIHFFQYFPASLLHHESPAQSITAISGLSWFNFFIATFVSLLLGNVFFYYAVHEIGPCRVGVYSYLEPVFTNILAVLLRGEHLTILQVTGLFLIFTGTWVCSLQALPQKAQSEA